MSTLLYSHLNIEGNDKDVVACMQFLEQLKSRIIERQQNDEAQSLIRESFTNCDSNTLNELLEDLYRYEHIAIEQNNCAFHIYSRTAIPLIRLLSQIYSELEFTYRFETDDIYPSEYCDLNTVIYINGDVVYERVKE